MADPLSILSVIGQSLPALTGLASDIYSMWDSNRRFDEQLKQQQFANQFAEKQFEETQRMNEWNRYLSENGVSVRANDLAKSGLSKVLASGSSSPYVAAQAAGNVNVSNFGQGFKANALLQGLQMSKNFQKQDSELQIMKKQISSLEKDLSIKDEELQGLKLKNESQEIKNDYDRYYTDYWKNSSSVPDSNFWIKLIAEGLGQRNISGRTAEAVTDFVDDNFGNTKNFFQWCFSTSVRDKTLEFLAKGLKVSKSAAKRFLTYVKTHKDKYIGSPEQIQNYNFVPEQYKK